jgi:hypothetical protein
MRVKFSTEEGHSVYVRAEDIRRIADYKEGSAIIRWLEGDDNVSQVVKGTADENYARLSEEERQRAAEYEALRQQQAIRQLSGQAPIGKPTPRGRPR